MRRDIARTGAAAVTALLLTAGSALAQSHAGIRAGVSGDPDQFFIGGHVETAPLAEHLTFRPNVEVGVGDNLTVVAVNLEFAYWIPLARHPWRVYLGAGPAAVITSHHAGPGRGNRGGSDVGGGFNVLLGIQHRRGLFAELKVGAVDSPEVKFTVGYAFR
jgi:hypothetical protein